MHKQFNICLRCRKKLSFCGGTQPLPKPLPVRGDTLSPYSHPFAAFRSPIAYFVMLPAPMACAIVMGQHMSKRNKMDLKRNLFGCRRWCVMDAKCGANGQRFGGSSCARTLSFWGFLSWTVLRAGIKSLIRCLDGCCKRRLNLVLRCAVMFSPGAATLILFGYFVCFISCFVSIISLG